MRKPDRNDEIRGEIKKGMTIYGYGRTEMAVFLRCSESTFSRRLKCPAFSFVCHLRNIVLTDHARYIVGTVFISAAR